MAYNYNVQFDHNRRYYDTGRNSFNYGGYQDGRRNPRQYRGAPKKHSGAKYHANTKNDNPAITGWNYSKRAGLVKVFIAPYSNTHQHKSEKGNTFENWMCKVEGVGFSEHFPVLVNLATKRAVIQKYGWVVSPNAPNGGYCGTFKRR
jgi:hypothetical protein